MERGTCISVLHEAASARATAYSVVFYAAEYSASVYAWAGGQMGRAAAFDIGWVWCGMLCQASRRTGTTHARRCDTRGHERKPMEHISTWYTLSAPLAHRLEALGLSRMTQRRGRSACRRRLEGGVARRLSDHVQPPPFLALLERVEDPPCAPNLARRSVF